MTIWETSDAHPRHFRLKLHKSVPPTRLDWINPCFRSHTHRNTHRMYAHTNAQTQFFAHHNEWINCATSCQKLHIFDMSLNLILTDGLLSFEFQFWIFNGLYWLYLLYRHRESIDRGDELNLKPSLLHHFPIWHTNCTTRWKVHLLPFYCFFQ